MDLLREELGLPPKGDPPRRLYACGSNGEGQLGLGYRSDKVLVPTPVPETTCMEWEGVLMTLHEIRCGPNQTFLRSSGAVVGAGDNRDKQIGYMPSADECEGRYLRFSTALDGRCFGDVAAAWKSTAFACRANDGRKDEYGNLVDTRLDVLGRGEWGELGRPGEVVHPDLVKNPIEVVEDRTRSVPTPFSHKIVRNAPEPLCAVLPNEPRVIAAGMYHYVLVTEDEQTEEQTVYGWGRSKNGQLGESFRSSRIVDKPTVLFDVPFPVHRLVCGQYFTYLVGDRESGEHIILGDDKHGIKSKAPPHIKGWKDVGATWNAIFVLFNDGTLTAWGKEDLWQLIPSNLPKIDQVAVGSDHIICITADKKVISWGWAEHGNCGDVSTLKQPLVKGYITGQWNELKLMGEPYKLGAGYSTSFVLTFLRSDVERRIAGMENEAVEKKFGREQVRAAWEKKDEERRMQHQKSHQADHS